MHIVLNSHKDKSESKQTKKKFAENIIAENTDCNDCNKMIAMMQFSDQKCK